MRKTFKSNLPTTPQASQGGMVLIIGLVILTLLTMITLNITKTVILQESMAFNTQERNKALQAAESATCYAWSILGTTSGTSIEDFINNAAHNGIYDLRQNNTEDGSKVIADWNAIYNINNWPWENTTLRTEMPSKVETTNLDFISVNENPMQLSATPQYVMGMHEPIFRKGSENKKCIPFTIMGAGKGSIESNTKICLF